jgi:hypothetical protein
MLCQELRASSIRVLADVIRSLRVGVTTEVDALMAIKAGLSARGITDYWYPAGEAEGVTQFGVILIFDTVDQPKRTTFASGRSIRASSTVRWNGTGYFYLSPQQVDAATGQLVWGDFGCSVYLGGAKNIRDYYRRSWQLSQSVISGIRDGELKTTLDVVAAYERMSRMFGVQNIAWSTTGATSARGGPLNIGHSFPDVRGLKSAHLSPAEMEDIRGRRVFLDGISDVPLTNSLWSLESRDSPESYPYGCISFHRLFCVLDGKFTLLADSPDLFELIDMQWIFE